MQESKSFKQMVKDGDLRRADALKARIEDIHEEVGFNLRIEGEDLESSIDALAEHIVTGGAFPPLEVRPRAGGGVFVVDGHRRRRALLKVADRMRGPDGELWVPIVAFNGNDAERVARVITSAEGRNLSPLEVAEGYRRLICFGWFPEQIAAKVGKTRQHVEQLLILAGANSDVKGMVGRGEVSASSAIDAVRKHGEGAGTVLGRAVDGAKSAGKSKATAGAINGRPLPRKLVDEAESALYRFAETTDAKTMSVSYGVVAELLDIVASMRDARKKQASRAQAQGVKEAQTEIDA